MAHRRTLQQYNSVTTERGVTTVPSALRHGAAIQPKTELTWVPLEPELWLVGPKTRHPERVAPAMAAALAEHSPFQKLMRRVMAGEIPQRSTAPGDRRYEPLHLPALTEEQMMALGAPAASSRRRRGRD
jgi:hypothetical protein